jgi:hypothetical protein
MSEMNTVKPRIAIFEEVLLVLKPTVFHPNQPVLTVTTEETFFFSAKCANGAVHRLESDGALRVAKIRISGTKPTTNAQ